MTAPDPEGLDAYRAWVSRQAERVGLLPATGAIRIAERIIALVGRHPDENRPDIGDRRLYAYSFFFGAKCSLIVTGALFWIEFSIHLVREMCS